LRPQPFVDLLRAGNRKVEGVPQFDEQGVERSGKLQGAFLGDIEPAVV
jgi:hypothetical protein